MIKQQNSRLQQENMKLRSQILTAVSSSLPTPNALPILLEELKSQFMEDFKKILLETITPNSIATIVETAKANFVKDMEDTLQEQVKIMVKQEVNKLWTSKEPNLGSSKDEMEITNTKENLSDSDSHSLSDEVAKNLKRNQTGTMGIIKE